jgi:hypothetical protein
MDGKNQPFSLDTISVFLAMLGASPIQGVNSVFAGPAFIF